MSAYHMKPTLARDLRRDAGFMPNARRYLYSFLSRSIRFSGIRCGDKSPIEVDLHNNHAQGGQQQNRIPDTEAVAAAAAAEQHRSDI